MKKKHTLKSYLNEKRGRASDLCAATGISPGWLSQMKLGVRDIPITDAIKIERATGGAVKCETMCPEYGDLVAYIRLTGRETKESDDPARAE
jgi:DNA-binding transcriptional regulator YdaS (Cro superfamily)